MITSQGLTRDIGAKDIIALVIWHITGKNKSRNASSGFGWY
jgi:hypothetical protein